MAKSRLNVYQIDFKYRKYLRKICINSLSYYRGIPLTWEDIYNNFLYAAPKYLEEYTDDMEITEQAFLGIKCKFFAFNYCKSFQTNKHKIMNDSVGIATARNIPLNDSGNVSLGLDTSIFTDDELIVYKAHFLDGKPYHQICEENDLTRYKVKALGKIIQAKMYSKLKN